MEVGDLIRLTGTSKMGVVMNVGASRAALGARNGYQASNNKVITVAWLHTDKIGRAWSNALELVNGSR